MVMVIFVIMLNKQVLHAIMDSMTAIMIMNVLALLLTVFIIMAEHVFGEMNADAVIMEKFGINLIKNVSVHAQ